MSSGAWDYPANTRGYTLGLVVELKQPGYAVRGSVIKVPKLVNRPWLNKKIGDVNGAVVEVEKEFSINKWRGKLSLLGFRNLVNAPLYE